jgi:murein DD-endopeptidase MepM/ murein hydrolase activator NlpD
VKPYRSAIRHDYKDLSSGSLTPRQRRWSWFVLGLALPVVTVALLLVSERNESKVPAPAQTAAATPPPSPILETAHEPLPLPLPEAPSATPVASELELEPAPAAPDTSTEFAGAIVDLLVERGDSLDVLFRRNGLSLADLAAMADLPEAGEHLRRLKPGDEIRISHADGRVLSLSRELNEVDVLSITKNDSGFAAATEQRDIDYRTVGAHGVIETSLFEAGTAAGMTDAVTMDMAYIFQWDVDFIQDVRVGDSFTVIYEERWRDGVKLRGGDIIAAEFVNQGKAYRAARYLDPSGRSDYYTPEGRSVRRAFIRAPVEFTRISSNFNPRRRHPVLNTIRAHRGVDYAAPTGTPVIAAGDGKVTFRGVEGGYGNAVILQHGGNITTLYGHLSRFGRQRVGTRVNQGDVIGYVGQSGLATGPHLHYEYRVGGTHKNPRTVELPAADPVAAEYRDDFTAATPPLWHQIGLYQQAQLAATAD